MSEHGLTLRTEDACTASSLRQRVSSLTAYVTAVWWDGLELWITFSTGSYGRWRELGARTLQWSTGRLRPRVRADMSRLALVTGGAGFIGSHLVGLLVEHGWSVRILDNLDPHVHAVRPSTPTGVQVVRGDVADPDVLEQALEGVSHVVHFAAAVGVGQSMYQISHYCRTNIMGTASLLEALVRRRDSIAKLLVASSMSIYGEGLYWCES